MKKALSIIIVLVIFTLYYPVQAQQLDLSNADSCILIDSKTGAVLYDKDSNRQKMYPASTTKIMTAALALEKGKLDQVMTASQAAVDDIGKDGMNIGILTGEQMRLRDLLDALLITSANETANIIAENISSSRQAFVDMMNEKARELGALNTHFANPCGAHNSDHYTTAADLAKIAKYAMTFDEFRKRVIQKTYRLPATNKHNDWPVLSSTNNLMKYTKSDLFTINGIKTGYTVPAGFCLVSSAFNDKGVELIAVVLGVRNDNAKNNVITYSKNLLTYGFENYSIQNVTTQGQFFKNVQVSDAKDVSTVQTVAQETVTALMPNEKGQWTLKENIVINPGIKAPLKKGDVLGYVEYSKDGTVIGKTNLIASADIEAKPGLKTIGTAIRSKGIPTLLKILIYTSIILILFIALRLILRYLSRKLRARKYTE